MKLPWHRHAGRSMIMHVGVCGKPEDIAIALADAQATVPWVGAQGKVTPWEMTSLLSDFQPPAARCYSIRLEETFQAATVESPLSWFRDLAKRHPFVMWFLCESFTRSPHDERAAQMQFCWAELPHALPVGSTYGGVICIERGAQPDELNNKSRREWNRVWDSPQARDAILVKAMGIRISGEKWCLRAQRWCAMLDREARLDGCLPSTLDSSVRSRL